MTCVALEVGARGEGAALGVDKSIAEKDAAQLASMRAAAGPVLRELLQAIASGDARQIERRSAESRRVIDRLWSAAGHVADTLP